MIGFLLLSPAFCSALGGGRAPGSLVPHTLMDVGRARLSLGLCWGPSPWTFLFQWPILDTLII